MRINTNVASLNAREAATNTQNNIASSLEKLSTGLKINKASDDASGLAIADKLRTQATSIGQGIDNGNSAVSLIQIADKSMSEQSNILDVVKAKLIQANTDTTSDAGREAIRKDINKLLEQLDNIASQTNYNGNTLLQAGYNNQMGSDQLKFQIGEDKDDVIESTSIQSNTMRLGGGEEALVQTSGLSTRNNLISQETSMIISGDGTNDITLDGYASGTSINVNMAGTIGELTFSGSSGTISNVDVNTQVVLEQLANITSSAIVSGSDGMTIAGSKIVFTDADGNTLTKAEASGNTGTIKATLTVTDMNGNTLGDFSIQASGGISAISSALTFNRGTVTNGIEADPTFSAATGTVLGLGGNAIDTVNTSATAASGANQALLNTFSVGSMTIEQSSASGSLTISGNSADVMIYNNNDAVGEELKVTTGVNGDGATGTIYGGSTLSALKSLATGQLSKAQADKFQEVVDSAITQLNEFRSDLGSTQNQIESAVRNLMTQETNVKAAESIIRDVDYAEESANFNKQNIISQAGSYAMSQANALQQNVLRLLQ